MEAVDPVFQAKMLDMLKQTGRPEMVVGWFVSAPPCSLQSLPLRNVDLLVAVGTFSLFL